MRQLWLGQKQNRDRGLPAEAAIETDKSRFRAGRDRTGLAADAENHPALERGGDVGEEVGVCELLGAGLGAGLLDAGLLDTEAASAVCWLAGA